MFRVRKSFRTRHSSTKQELALAELLCTAGLAKTNLLTFDFTSVAGNEAGAGKNGLEACIVVDQGAGDAVTDCTSLTGFAAAMNVDHDVEGFDVFGQFKRLHDDHAAGFTMEVLIQWTAVDGDNAGTTLDENTSYGALAATSAVIVITDHLIAPLLEVEDLWLLSSVWVFAAGVDLELLDHSVAERTLWKHALNGNFESTTRMLCLHFLEGRFVDAAWVASVTIVGLLAGLFGGKNQLVSIDDNNIIARINVRGKFWLVLAAKAQSDFASKAAEHLITGIDHEPFALNLKRLGREGLHCVSPKMKMPLQSAGQRMAPLLLRPRPEAELLK